MKVSVLSAAYGGHVPWEFPGTEDAVVVTDNPNLSVRGWRTVVDPLSHLTPRMAALVPKARPELYVSDADIVVWIDAQFCVVSQEFIPWCVEHLGDNDVAMLRHQGRSAILAEAHAGQGPAGRSRWVGQDTIEQAKHYIESGHPDGWGLWTTGLLVRKMSPEVEQAGREWLSEIAAWSTHCQLSAPYVFRNAGLKVGELPHPGWNNKLFRLSKKLG
jgi:hypothetical protein